MTEELQDKELTDIRYLRARMTGNVGLALDHAYNLGFFDGEKNVADKIRAEIEKLPTTTCTETHRIYIDADDFKENVLAILNKYKGESEGKE